MKSNSSLKIILITVACILIAALSFFFLAGILSSPETYAGIIRSIDDKVETVLKLTASSTAASAGITAIPGDAGTPIAEKLADFSEYGILILCVLYAEKYLLSILGSGVFKYIIPIACILYPIGFFRDLEGIKPILKKIAIVSLALYFVIPLSVHISDRIYDTYQASIDNTISAAEDLAEDATPGLDRQYHLGRGRSGRGRNTGGQLRGGSKRHPADLGLSLRKRKQFRRPRRRDSQPLHRKSCRHDRHVLCDPDSGSPVFPLDHQPGFRLQHSDSFPPSAAQAPPSHTAPDAGKRILCPG